MARAGLSELICSKKNRRIGEKRFQIRIEKEINTIVA
jgi:hypothetical protein